MKSKYKIGQIVEVIVRGNSNQTNTINGSNYGYFYNKIAAVSHTEYTNQNPMLNKITIIYSDVHGYSFPEDQVTRVVEDV